jgi:hypothetical protein
MGNILKHLIRFRKSVWKAMSDSSYAKEFSRADQIFMKTGLSPVDPVSEQIGKRVKYELHHIKPIKNGGEVYDVSNILITTPRHHVKVLHAATKSK